MADGSSPEDRLMAVEMALAHLQHDVEQMHEVLIAMQRELKAAHRQVTLLEGKVRALEFPDADSPIDEKPPHY